MSLDSEIISEAKARSRINGTELDAMLAQRIDRIFRSYCKKDDWPQLLVPGSTLVIGSDQAYALPTDFDRFKDDTIFWDVDSEGNVRGGAIPVSLAADGLTQHEYFSNTSLPRMAIVTYTALNPYLSFYPHFTTSTDTTILFNYYKQPPALTGAGVPIAVAQLEEVLISALCKELVRYHGLSKDGNQQALYFAQEERAEYSIARSVLYSSPR